jgi:hypothetical protein
MSESKTRSAKTRPDSRDFGVVVDTQRDPELIRQAHSITDEYRIILDEVSPGRFVGTASEMPRITGEGGTPDECVAETRRLLAGAAAIMLKAGQNPPRSAKARSRGEQLNVRLTAQEKLLLEDAAQSLGFRSVSDLVRTRALQGLVSSGD